MSNEDEAWTIERAKMAFPTGTEVTFIDPGSEYETLIVDDVIVGDPYLGLRRKGDAGTRPAVVLVPTKCHGGVAVDELWLGAAAVLELRRTIADFHTRFARVDAELARADESWKARTR